MNNELYIISIPRARFKEFREELHSSSIPNLRYAYLNKQGDMTIEGIRIRFLLPQEDITYLVLKYNLIIESL
jgi:hypothetical protein